MGESELRAMGLIGSEDEIEYGEEGEEEQEDGEGDGTKRQKTGDEWRDSVNRKKRKIEQLTFCKFS